MLDLVPDPALPRRASLHCAICGRKLRIRASTPIRRALHPDSYGRPAIIGPDCWQRLRDGDAPEGAEEWEALDG